MTTSKEALTGIEVATARLNEAAEMWTATDLSRVESCGDVLEGSLVSLMQSASLLQHDPAALDNDMVSPLVLLQSEIARLQQLVDAAAAFVRGATILSGDGGPDYTPAGQYVAPGDNVSSELIG